MFPDLEFIKTILNGLRSRIEKVENWVVSFVRTNRPNWVQNDPDALDYVKNRPFYEEAKFITEGDITDDNSILPEGKYELGKIYIVEVDGVQHQLEFMSAKSGEGFNYVGFNLIGERWSVTTIDSTKPMLYHNMGTTSPADGLYSLVVSNITKPAYVRVLQLAIHKIDEKYLPAPTADTAGAIKADAAETADIRPVRLGADGKLYSSGIPIFTTSGTGRSYTANVPEITELVNGMLVVMVPHVASTTYAPTLTINGRSTYLIRRFISSQADTATMSTGIYTNWLKANVPVLLMYTSGKWVACTFPKPDAEDLWGTVMVERGGTGLTNLKAGSYLVGSGKSYVLLKTPSEVLADIGAIPAPITAEVGQAIVVKAVDENGKPTEWEAADMASGVGGKSAYDYAVEGGYTGTEAEFAAKLAAEKFVNPNALTFTGAVEGSYDGSAPLSVEIPSGGGGSDTWETIIDFELTEDVGSVTFTTDISGNPFSLKEFTIFVVQTPIVGQTTNNRIVFAPNKNGWGHAGNVELKPSPKETDETVYSFIHANTVDGRLNLLTSVVSSNYSTVRSILNESTVRNNYNGNFSINVNGTTNELNYCEMPLKKINFVGLGSIILGTGSKIVVRGIRT